MEGLAYATTPLIFYRDPNILYYGEEWNIMLDKLKNKIQLAKYNKLVNERNKALVNGDYKKAVELGKKVNATFDEMHLEVIEVKMGN